jgi:predicted AAA+ superfamily ATPase
LAGRMAIIDLLPLSQAEIERCDSGFLDALFGDAAIEFTGPVGTDFLDRVMRGGFPEACGRASESRRDAWFADYVRTLLERDVRDVANIEAFGQLPQLLRLLAARTGETLNVSGLSRDLGIPNTSLHRYLDMLRGVFLIHHVPAWSRNLGTRLIKAPKVYLVDTGLLGHLANLSAKPLAADRDRLGPVIENFVAMELKKLATISQRRPVMYHLRTVKQREVDLILEDRNGHMVGIEVKASPSIQFSDFEGLKYLKELAPGAFRRGVVLYTGGQVVRIAPDLLALPLDALWRL